MFERFSYRGWNNAYRLSNGVVELVVTAEVGPRILFCGFRDGVNQLHEVAEDAGKAGGSEFRLYGTHRLWVSPEAERTYYPVFPTLLRLRCHNTITPFALWHRQRSCRQEPTCKKNSRSSWRQRGSQVRITHRIKNHDAHSTTLAPWSPTMMRSGGREILPLSRRLAMDKDHYLPVGVSDVWSFTDFADPRWVLGTCYIQLQQLTHSQGRFKEQMGRHLQLGWLGSLLLPGRSFCKACGGDRRRPVSRFRL